MLIPRAAATALTASTHSMYWPYWVSYTSEPRFPDSVVCGETQYIATQRWRIYDQLAGFMIN